MQKLDVTAMHPGKLQVGVHHGSRWGGERLLLDRAEQQHCAKVLIPLNYGWATLFVGVEMGGAKISNLTV